MHTYYAWQFTQFVDYPSVAYASIGVLLRFKGLAILAYQQRQPFWSDIDASK
jgi:hypothetical protein